MNKGKFMLNVKSLLNQILIACVMCCFFACSDKEKEDFSNIPGIQNETWPGIVYCSPDGEVFTYSFKALGKWTALSSDDWCKVLPVSGNKGNSNLKVVVDWNETAEIRSATITINVEGYKDVVISLEQEKKDIPPLEMNLIIDELKQLQ